MSDKVRYSLEDWRAEVLRRGGRDCRFVCPICGNEASPNDWKALLPDLEDPGRAATQCIGRAMPRDQVRAAFGHGADVERPCDYAAFGLFRLAPVTVDLGGEIIGVFAFADEARLIDPLGPGPGMERDTFEDRGA